MSESENAKLREEVKQAWERAALEARRVLKNGSKAYRLEQENAELRKEKQEEFDIASGYYWQVVRLKEENDKLREIVEELEQEIREPGLGDVFASNALELLGENAELRERIEKEEK